MSFHKYGDNFFPGTGCLSDVGEKNGRYYSVNVPLKDGVDDNTFKHLFQPIMSKVMEVFKPGAIVMQCGKIHHVNRISCSKFVTSPVWFLWKILVGSFRPHLAQSQE